tara:strand:- start:70 stop:267 length:198 start_codon:yes stop_codon:yes gene_type:complete
MKKKLNTENTENNENHEQSNQALSTLIQAAVLGQSKGAYNFDEATVINNAIKYFSENKTETPEKK